MLPPWPKGSVACFASYQAAAGNQIFAADVHTECFKEDGVWRCEMWTTNQIACEKWWEMKLLKKMMRFFFRKMLHPWKLKTIKLTIEKIVYPGIVDCKSLLKEWSFPNPYFLNVFWPPGHMLKEMVLLVKFGKLLPWNEWFCFSMFWRCHPGNQASSC